MTTLIEFTHSIGEEAIKDDSVFPVLSTVAAIYNIPVCSSNFSIPSSGSMTDLIEFPPSIGEEAIKDDSVFPVLSTVAAIKNF